MEDHHYLYLGLALVSLLVMLAKGQRSAMAHGHGLRLPPGPWQLPILGSLHHMAGKLPHHAMRDLARRLGPLMLLRLRELPVLVASSADVAREIMRANNLAFATRPMSPTGKILLGEGSYGLIFAPYGDGWRQLSMELFSARPRAGSGPSAPCARRRSAASSGPWRRRRGRPPRR